MTRGAAHPAQLRAEAIAAVLAGMSLSEAARRYGISKGTLGNWLAEQNVGTVGTNNARDPETIGDLIFDLVGEHLIALRAQLQTVTRPEWLERQSAADIALLLGAERDTLLRLLAGFRPVERQPELDAGPARATPGAADDAD